MAHAIEEVEDKGSGESELGDHKEGSRKLKARNHVDVRSNITTPEGIGEDTSINTFFKHKQYCFPFQSGKSNSAAIWVERKKE